MSLLKHAFLITAHKDPNLLLKIMKLLSSENHYIIVNLDKKMSGYKEIASKIFQIVPNSTFIFNNVAHGGYSQIATTLKMLRIAQKYDVDYCHLLSGQDFPCKTNPEFDNYFVLHNGESFMWYDTPEQHELWSQSKYPFRVNRLYFNDIPGRKYPFINKLVFYLNNVFGKLITRKPIPNLHAGWNWFSWHRNVIDFVLSQHINNKSFFRRFYYTHCCDEIIFHTLLYPHISKLKIHTDNSLRYINWSKKISGRSSSNSPLILNEEELSDIESSNVFFCRKVDSIISRKLIDYLTDKVNLNNVSLPSL